jgi:agmatinase
MKAVKCLLEPDELYDIAIIGAPFDTAVSYRPGKPPNTSIHLLSS